MRLDAGNALAYLRFFCFFVRADESPFLILESLDQWELPAKITEADRAEIAASAHPSWLIHEGERAFTVVATTFYGNALFATEYEIQKSGMIDMLQDTPVAAGLGFRVDRPLT